MADPTFQLAQVNIGRARGEMTDPIMAGFVNRLVEINALADASPGFVWRLQTEDGDATVMRSRRDWFERFDRVFVALWWVPSGHRPTVAEAVERLSHLEQHGPTGHSFTFAEPFDVSGRPVPRQDVPRGDACPAT
jgi:uncharacterized protein DUF3291